MSLRQQTLVQALPANGNEKKGGMQTRARGVKKEVQYSTPETEFVKGKETRRKKLNGRDSKLEDYYDVHGNDKTIIENDHSYSEKDFNQSSISSVSTNTTLDYERINQLKSIKLSSEFTQMPSGNSITIGGNSNIMQAEAKPIKIDIGAQKETFDFKNLIGQQEKEKLKQEEERKAKVIEDEQKKKKLIDNFDLMKKKQNLSSNTMSLISKILDKSDKKAGQIEGSYLASQTSTNKISSAKKLDLIQERLLANLNVKSPIQQDTKMVAETEQVNTKMVDEKDENILQSEIPFEIKEEVQAKDNTENLNEQDNKQSKFEQMKVVLNNEKAQEIMAKPSIKQRYEDLLRADRIELALPYKYKQLLQAFEKFDECISFFKERNKPTLFNDLKYNMEQTMRSTINIKQLQQIIFLYPQAFQLKWVKNDVAFEKWDLSVNTTSDENEKRQVLTKADRIAKLKNSLIEKVKYFHRLYLKSKKLDQLEEEILESCKWHSDFDLQGVPNIEEQALPLKPFEIKVESLQETVQKNNVKNEILARLMQTKAQKQEEKEKQKKELIEKSLYISTKDNNTGLSDRLYQLIKAKEDKLNEEKLRSSLMQNKNPMEGRISEVKKVVENMICYYIQRQVSNIFYVQVIDHLVNSKKMIISKESAVEIVDHLIQSCSFWISLIPNKQGNIIRIDKSIPISKILAEVEKIQN